MRKLVVPYLLVYIIASGGVCKILQEYNPENSNFLS